MISAVPFREEPKLTISEYQAAENWLIKVINDDRYTQGVRPAARLLGMGAINVEHVLALAAEERDAAVERKAMKS
jgi:hypothetical protein